MRRVTSKKTCEGILRKNQLITEEQLQRALQEREKTGEYLHQVIVDLRLANQKQLLETLSAEWGVEYILLSEEELDPELVRLFPEPMAMRTLSIPVNKTEDVLSVAMADPFDPFALQEIRTRTQFKVKQLLALPKDIEEKLKQIYGEATDYEKLLEETLAGVEGESVTVIEGEEELSEPVDIADAENQAQQAPVIALVNNIIAMAIEEEASDIHIEPFETRTVLRYRIDGDLHDMPISIPPVHHNRIIARIKILASLNIAESRRPQDGRIKIRVKGADYELRVSIIPTIYRRESVVMRVLGGSSIRSLSELGFLQENLKLFESAIRKPYGLILVSGPTGSGKSTTLFSALNTINLPEIKILTIENPVEYNLEGVVQVQTNSAVDLSFATGLRAFLRQDPDVIMVGEMRDKETATTAVEAALTGHLVFSTIHTNDAPSTIIRLTEMGIEPVLISDALQLIIAQRLTRKICEGCKEPYDPSEEEMKMLEKHNIDTNGVQLYRGKGCKRCDYRGVKGRTGIHEVMALNDKIKELILNCTPAYEILEVAKENGMRTLREDGFVKATMGITTIEDVVKITSEF